MSDKNDRIYIYQYDPFYLNIIIYGHFIVFIKLHIKKRGAMFCFNLGSFGSGLPLHTKHLRNKAHAKNVSHFGLSLVCNEF